MKILNFNIYGLFLALIAGILLMSGCKDETTYAKTRLFRPVLNEELMAELNTIIVNMGNIREATSYTIEVSRDTFTTIDYTIETDTSYVVINEELLNGDPLLWNTLYQVRATAHAASPEFDSKVSDLGNVRTERFPSILNIPGVNDVIDVAARVTWQVLGAPVTKIRTFAPDDLKLTSPIAEYDVSEEDQVAGETIVAGLEPETAYQIAIYSGASGEALRGWENYVTLEKGVDPNDANVIDLTGSEDPDAVGAAVMAAADGNIILLKKGVLYNFPAENLTKSITIRGAYGFGAQKAILFTTGNWNIENGATINHIRFIDLELRGEDIGGDYVFNPNNDMTTTVDELTFDNCIVNNFRGIIRVRTSVYIKNYTINNCIVHHIGGYGIFTADTDGDGGAAIDNITLSNSTFSKVNTFMQSRQNSQSLVIDACTLNEETVTGGRLFRWRGGEGFNNVINGISITNSVWGHGWDEGETGAYDFRGKAEGLDNTSFTVVNTYATADFSFTPDYEIPGFPALNYSGTAADLWVDPYEGLNFNFKDSGFAGKYDSGDPRWRAKL
ncbi:MAG: DUF4957 domain-containing protein [Lewinellaceae bacterium]|nr:DUF4957 domain-containing protein [Phaeodactylibacter sp.]MCB9040997.1 DUF4957 domain-containing protein [Lewinellaceae bacterium]